MPLFVLLLWLTEVPQYHDSLAKMEPWHRGKYVLNTGLFVFSSKACLSENPDFLGVNSLSFFRLTAFVIGGGDFHFHVVRMGFEFAGVRDADKAGVGRKLF